MHVRGLNEFSFLRPLICANFTVGAWSDLYLFSTLNSTVGSVVWSLKIAERTPAPRDPVSSPRVVPFTLTPEESTDGSVSGQRSHKKSMPAKDTELAEMAQSAPSLPSNATTPGRSGINSVGACGSIRAQRRSSAALSTEQALSLLSNSMTHVEIIIVVLLVRGTNGRHTRETATNLHTK